MPNDWLKDKHPIYMQREVEWRRNERRLRGGMHILGELRKFDWETSGNPLLMEQAQQDLVEHKDDIPTTLASAPGQHYAMRQAQAMYTNFPDAFMSMLVGHLVRKAPKPGSGLDFGGLGSVNREARSASPSFAELVYFNTDGVGNDGSQWDAFWAGIERWAGATGHRWLFVEASTQPGLTEQQVRDGRRPYLLHLSPLDITNWDFVEGRLAWAIHQLPPRAAKIVDSKMVRESTGPRRLYVRKGFAGFGDAFKGGGWWTFDAKGDPIEGDGMIGTWEKTRGEIPCWPHFYERDTAFFSRPGTTELGNAAVATMNLDSAANFDAWDAAKSLTYFLGVSAEAYQVAVDKEKCGSQWIPVPSSNESSQAPAVVDSAAGAVPAEVFQKRLQTIRDAVREISSLEASSSPDSSGLAKTLGFQETKSPRLAMMASELETSQNIALMFLELRFGITVPKGSVKWPRDFALKPILDGITELFDLQDKSGTTSRTMTVRGLLSAGEEAGLITGDDDKAKITAELETSFDAGADRSAQAAALLREFGGNGAPTPTPTPPVDAGVATA